MAGVLLLRYHYFLKLSFFCIMVLSALSVLGGHDGIFFGGLPQRTPRSPAFVYISVKNGENL